MRVNFSRFGFSAFIGFAGLTLAACTGGDDSIDDGGQPSTYTLTVEVIGNGAGKVTSTVISPAISCEKTGGVCESEQAPGTSVTLTADPADDSDFAGWQDVTCTGGNTQLTCTFTLTKDQPVKANFGLEGAIAPDPVIGLTSSNKLISFKVTTPDAAPTSSVALSGVPAGFAVKAIDYRAYNGLLYGLALDTASSPSASQVCVIDPKTGAVTSCQVMRTNPSDPATGVVLSGTSFGTDFDPQFDCLTLGNSGCVLRVISNTGQNVRVDVFNGLTVIDTATGTGFNAAAHSNNFSGANGTALFAINDGDDSLYLINPPNTGAAIKVGALGISTTGASGFDIVGNGTGTDADNTAYMAAITGGLSRLYSINLGTGTASLIASINTGDGSSVTDIAVKPAGSQVAAGDTYALVGGNQLISFNRATPGTLLTRTFVAGLKANDQLVGMDYRFKDFKLYALGALGNLYTLDTSSGIASFVAALSGTGFSGFNASAGFGVDFDPVADTSGVDTGSLEIIDSTSQRLSVVVDGANAGKVTRYANVNHDPPGLFDTDQVNHGGIKAIGYTNSFFSTRSQTLYAIDVSGDQLYVIQQAEDSNNNLSESEVIPVNGGAKLGSDVESKDGLDVDGITGDAWAALRVGGVTGLYKINLTSGAIGGAGTSIGDGTLDIRGLALPAPKKPVVYGLSETNTIVTFAPDAPEAATAPLAVSGLASGDQLVALHVRPADRKLFALARSGNLYTVNPTPTTTFAATLVTGASLQPDPNDNASPFYTALPADGPMSMDFDPAAGLQPSVASLRIINPTGGTYLRANVTNGSTFADSALALPTSSSHQCSAAQSKNISATAYNKSGTLYVINRDSNASCLYTASPSGGTGSMSIVGYLFQGPVPNTPSGGSFNSSKGGFDVVGGQNGLSLAALDIGTAGVSTLYNISLGNGRASNGKPIGTAGTTPLLIDMTILLAP